MKRSMMVSLLCTTLAMLHAGSAAADGGTIVRVSGPVSVQGGGKTVPGAVGGPVLAGDTVTTGASGRAQVRFEDDSVFALGGTSQFKVDEFQHKRQAGGSSGVFSLLRGGFRTITGLIGKSKGDRYEVRTGVATIGVRGSAYGAILCQGQCSKRFKDGLYVKAENGIIVVANTGGSVELRAGQAAYAEAEGSAPVRVAVTPFDDPALAADFAITIQFDTQIKPPRIEPDPPPSPS